MSFWTRTKQIFKKRPLLMNMASFSTMYVGAEVVQQAVLVQTSAKKSMDWSNVGRYAVIGLAGIGPVLFYWYRYLDKVLPAVTKVSAIQKAFVDQAISSPACIAIFFVGMSAMEGKDKVFDELKAKFWPTYKFSCCFWLPAQTVNFLFLPPYTRVAYVGFASFLWVNILCFIKRQQIAVAEDHRIVLAETK